MRRLRASGERAGSTRHLLSWPSCGPASAGRRAKANEAVLSRFLQSDCVTVLLPDEQTTHVYADGFMQLRAAGTPVPTNDLWIAALVIQHDLVLFSRNRHFDVLPQIARISSDNMKPFSKE